MNGRLINHRLFLRAAAVLICFAISFPIEALAVNHVTIRPVPDDQAILFNLGTGLVINHEFYCDGAPYNAWRAEIFNIAYMRFRWKDLEPEEGKCNFQPVLNWMRPWLKAGYRVAFGVKSSDMEMTCTPDWVFRAGVPAVSHRGGRQRDPAYWHPLYMEKYVRFVKKLGEAFNGMNGLEYVDQRGIGIWGEMHLGTFIPGMWTKDELARTGYSDHAYKTAYKRMIDAYRIAFPATRLFLNIGAYEDISDYAASRQVGLRSDCLNVTAGVTLREASRQFQKYCFNDGKRAVPCHYEAAFEGREKNPLLLEATVDTALRDPVSYLFADWGNLHAASPEIRQILKNAARRIGYRLVPVSISFESGREFRPGELLEVPLVEEWLNRGIAPTYFSFSLIFSLVDAGGRSVYEEIVLPPLATSAWYPLQLVKFRHSLTMPTGLENGDYILRLAVTDPGKPGSRIRLGIKGADENAWYALAHIRIDAQENNRRRMTVRETMHK